MTIYKNELAVYTTDVTVTAGGTKILNSITITDDPSDNDVTWRIGDWDGTPLEFKNGSLMTKMHPQTVALNLGKATTLSAHQTHHHSLVTSLKMSITDL